MPSTASLSAVELLVFEVGGQRFGIRSREVREVLRAVSLSVAPQAMAGVDGVMNLRGHMVPVLDIRGLFRMPSKEVEHTEQFIVCQGDDRLMALRADRTIELRQIAADCLEPITDATAGPLTAAAKVSDGLILILDPSNLLPRRGLSAHSVCGIPDMN